tara:strand:- start:625 stop:1269 length:645 start_codon:yes stop_codon:yes gene_type:complete
MTHNPQINTWMSNFGEEYTNRNTFDNTNKFNEFYLNRYSIGRDEFYKKYLSSIPKDSYILEVGSNIGNQLSSLSRVGYKNLYGIEIQRDAINYAHEKIPSLDIIYGQAQDIPFKDNYFDAVFTNNVLIHISPKNIKDVMGEIYRSSKKYIFGFEYFAEEFLEINYRQNDDLLWKANYCKLFIENFPDLKIIKKEIFIPKDEPENKDQFYILEKV